MFRCTKDDTPSGDGCSLYFDGSNDLVKVIQVLPSSITISGWAKLINFAQVQNTFINSNPHTVLAISLNRTGIGDIYVYIGNGAGWIGVPGIISSTNMVVNKWHQVTYTANNTTSKLYLDGKLVGSVNIVPSNWGSYYNFGALTPPSQYLKGFLDNVRIYEQALSEAQIQQLYAEGAKKHNLAIE